MSNLGSMEHPVNVPDETESSEQQPSRRYRRITKAKADFLTAPDRYMYVLDMPGLESRHIKVKVENNILFITGKRNSYRSREIEMIKEERSASYGRKFHLRWDFNLADIRALYKKGVLTVIVGRRKISDTERPRSVTIRVS